MKRVKLLFFGLLAGSGLAWVCQQPELSKALVKKSDLIFEGKLTTIDKVSPDVNGNDLLLTFIPLKIYKGKQRDTVFLRSSNEKNGFVNRFTVAEQYLGGYYLIYTTKKNGQFTFDACQSRRVNKTALRGSIPKDEEVTENNRLDSLYTQEVKTLEKLLRSK